jgi:DNA-binding PadR family transcriptional regulator
MAQAFDISKVSVVKILAKLETMGYIEKNAKGHKRATKKIYEAFDSLKELSGLGKESLPIQQNSGKESLPDGKESLPNFGKESLPNSKIDNSKNNNKKSASAPPAPKKESAFENAVENNRNKARSTNGVEAYKALPFPAHLEGARAVWCKWLDGQYELGKPITRAKCEALISNLSAICPTVQEAVASIERGILNPNYPTFYNDKKEESKPQSAFKSSIQNSQVRGRTGSNFD